MMKNVSRILFVLICLVLMPSYMNAEEIRIDDAKLQEMIQKVIKENPKLIFEAYHEYQNQLRLDNQKAQMEESFKNRLEDVVSSDNPVKGSPESPITIFEYSDFECPYCSRAASTVHQLMEKYPNKIRLVYKNNPLDFHKNALAAAKAALAAGKQGKFWEYHDVLYQNSNGLNEELYQKTAAQLGLNIEKFNADRASEHIAKQIEFEKEQAKKLKLTGTPAFIINGVLVKGAQSLDYFENVVQRILAEIEKK